MHKLKQYGRFANGREDSIRVLKQLLKEYEEEHNMNKNQSDDEYLSKFDEKDIE